jgi:hypothetical protein
MIYLTKTKNYKGVTTMKGHITIKLSVCENARIGYKPKAEKTFSMIHNLPYCTNIREFVISACRFKYGVVPMSNIKYKFEPIDD